MSGGTLTVIGSLVVVFSLLAFAVWWAGFWPDYMNCIRNSEGDKTDCLTDRIEEMPPIKDAVELKEACNETDLKCLAKIGEIAVTEKLQDVE